ncbi:hypothetical protein [Streptomyces sp. YPW6]|uniref:hypothetical protein n=1 Tax=Streptomyces sp. YPW6 TaxID=2840373 RepID=UPI003D725A7D
MNRGLERGSGPRRLSLRPAAAHLTSGAAEKTTAAPVGNGWNGSFDAGYNPSAAVLVPGCLSPFATARLLADQTRWGAGTKRSRSRRAKTAASPAVTSVRVMQA